MEGITGPWAIQIYLLGSLGVKRGGEAVRGFESDKARALLAYLALERDFPHPREMLAELFWPDLSPAAARHNLSQVIFSLRDTLESQGAREPLFLADRSSVELNPAAGAWVDALAFEKLIHTIEAHAHEQAEMCANCMDLRRQAVALYREDFLRGLTVEGSEAFDDWLIQKRERLHQMAIDALDQLARYHERRGEFGPSMEHARRQIELEPWREEAHRQFMRGLAHSGQRGAALAQFEICRQALEDELGVTPEVETRALYDHIRSAERGRRHNLPTQSTPFIGRETEIAEILLSLAHPDCRLLTLLGPGGVGKTRTALQVASLAADRFLDGVWFVPLVGAASRELLLPAIASALDFYFSEKLNQEAQLLDYLSRKELLLVLDNFEHLQGGAGLVAEILRRAPGVKILVTSRVRLNLAQAWTVNLAGLTVPAGEGEEDFQASSAVQLFQLGARRAQPDFQVGENERVAVQRICVVVEGLPLAIELAASWTRVLTCAEILAEIERGIGFLESDAVDLPARHRSMRAVIETSWQLLGAGEQQVFCRLGIFPAGFTRHAAEQIAGARLAQLARLVDTSLVRKFAGGRYELHELLRQYALETLAQEEGDLIETQGRFGAYYAGLVEERTADLAAGGRRGAISEIEQELENIETAWTWAVKEDRQTLLRLMDGFFWFFEWRSRYKEGRELFREALQPKEPGETWLPGLMVRCARFHSHLAEYAQAEELFRASAEALRRGNDRAGLALLLEFWGDLERETGDYSQARSRLEESVALFRELERTADLALALNHLGIIVHRLGEYEPAQVLLSESLTLFRKIENSYGIAIAVHNLGHVAFDLGDYAAAEKRFQESLAARIELGDEWGAAMVHNNLGNVQYALEDYARAEKFFQESLDRSNQLGDRRGIAVVMNNLGLISVEQGNYSRAEELYQASLEACLEIGNQQGVSIALNNLGEVAGLRRDHERAYRYHQESLGISRAISYARGIMYALEFLGQDAVRLARLEEASGYFREALQRAWDAQAMPRILQAIFGLGLVFKQSGHVGRAAELFQIVAAHPASEKAAREEARALLVDELKLPESKITPSKEMLEEAVKNLLAEPTAR
ncbi:MAG TPA: tetratricopeptide repeat protein [Anaerolineaceae bacterium]|nr:tetratricopeptide repeat protein [Anaerolineaceae bacterium]